MAVTIIDQNGAASSEVRNLVQNLRNARAAAKNIQELNVKMDSGQLLEIMGLNPATVPEIAWSTNVNALVVLLDDSTVGNFTGLLV